MGDNLPRQFVNSEYDYKDTFNCKSFFNRKLERRSGKATTIRIGAESYRFKKYGTCGWCNRRSCGE